MTDKIVSDFVAIRNSRNHETFVTMLTSLQSILQGMLAKKDDTLVTLFKEWVEEAISFDTVYLHKVIEVDWGSLDRSGTLDSFSLVYRSTTHPGTLFRIERTVPEVMFPLEAKAKFELHDSFVATIQDCLRANGPDEKLAMAVLRRTLFRLFELHPYVVKMKVDNGLHITLKEPNNPSAFEIYLGGCFTKCVKLSGGDA
jgi:hypothetical protein